MPEPKWVMRRILTFATVIWSAAVLTYIAMELAANDANAALLTLAIAVIILHAAVQVIYLVAPSAEYLGQIANLVRAARGASRAQPTE